MAAENGSRRRWLIPVAVWCGATAVLVIAWRRSRAHNPEQQLPAWLSRVARRTGPVVYDDPDLALRVQLSRLIVIETAAAGAWLAIVERRRLSLAVRRLVMHEADPLNLAIFRIVVFRQVYDVCYFDFIARIASLPEGLQYPPLTCVPRWGPLARFASWPSHNISPAAIEAAGKVMKYAAVTGMLGLFSRTSAGLVSVLFAIAWGRLQWYGKVDHHHHLLWFCMLLALSPSGDALSADWLIALLRGKKLRGKPGPQYGIPIAFSMILTGLVYIFPGLWKSCRSGLDWAWSENPKLSMQTEWRFYGDWLPGIRFDRYPLLYRLGALGTLLFELSFVWLLLGRRMRMVAGALGTGFHLMTYATMNIEFETLRNCYVMFVDWGWLRQLLPGVSADAPETVLPAPGHGQVNAGLIGGTLLVAVNVWAGAIRASDGWPFCCYPKFDGLYPPFYRTMRIVVTFKDGSERPIVPDDYRNIFGNRWNNLLHKILKGRGDEERKMKLRLIWQVLGRTETWVADAQRVRFYSMRSFVDPSRWLEEPDDPQLLYEMDVEA